VDDGDRTFQHEPAGAWTLEIIDKGLTTRAHETPPLFVHGGITPRGGGTSTSSITSQPGVPRRRTEPAHMAAACHNYSRNGQVRSETPGDCMSTSPVSSGSAWDMGKTC